MKKMMKHYYLFSFILFVIYSVPSFSQTHYYGNNRSSHNNTLFDSIRHYFIINNQSSRSDTTSIVYNKYFGPNVSALSDSILDSREFDPEYYRLFVPLTYYKEPIASLSDFHWRSTGYDTIPRSNLISLEYDKTPYVNAHRVRRLVNKALLNTYIQNCHLIKATEDEIMSREVFREERPQIPAKTHVANLFKPDPVEDEVGKAQLKVYKPNWWTHGGSFSLQTTQNYISKNWYQGGENTTTMLGYISFNANYNDKEKIQFDNQFEGRLGVTSSPSDTCHHFLISSDLLRIYSKLGIQATNKWYYTITGEFNTQFCRAFQKNTNTVLAAFLAPANLIFSAGMDYKFKKKNIDFSLLLSPFAYNLRVVYDSDVSETRYGIKQGKKSLQNYGSKITATWTWKFTPTVTWKSRFYYFTDYDKVEQDWENTFDFYLNKYFSAQLFLHERFDDSVKPTSGHSYFQIKEYFSLGLKYAW
jgi:hypothetical protein